MAFLSTFTGMTVALTLWAALYGITSSSKNPLLRALAPHLEALSLSGQCLFVVLSVVLSLLTYRLLRPKAGEGASDRADG